MKKQPTKLPRGRPQKPDEERADALVQLRLTASEKAVWQEAAERDEMKLSAWIKDRLNKAASSQKKQTK
jgi:hypothetical protein